MSVLSVYVAGVSTTGVEIISKAVKEVFGECNVFTIDRDKLRYSVRLGIRDSSVVLIVLDSASIDECSDIIGDTFSKDNKLYKYTDDRSLALHLNNLYGTDIDIPDDSDIDLSSYQIFDESVSDDTIEKYESQLRDKDAIITNLGYRIRELEEVLSDLGISDSDDSNSDNTDTELNDKIAKLSDENLSLRGMISDKEAEISRVNGLLAQKENELGELNNRLSTLNTTVSKLKSEIKSLSDELNQERVSSSQKSGSIRDRDAKISELTTRVGNLESMEGENKRLTGEVSGYLSDIRRLEASISTLRNAIKTKEDEIERLKKEIKDSGVTSETLEEYKKLLDKLENKYNSLVDDYNAMKADYDDIKPKYTDLLKKYKKLDEDYKESEGFITKLNTEKIQLTARISYLESNTESHVSSDADSVLAELNSLRRKYAETQGNIFNIISMKSLPRSEIKVPIFKVSPGHYKNIKFQFSGSIESRKGTCKCLFNECISSKDDRFLIVDITSEPCVDYVFQMNSIVDGLEWFASGGGVQKYISPTCLPNVKVLIPKIGYINDSYFLTVNWESRLNELENSGYKVILYCGDVSNLVGRVLFESFSDVGYTSIYVKGNAIGSRSIVANSVGLSGIKSSVIGYFDFDKNMLKFYNIMSKKCKCRIISYVK